MPNWKDKSTEEMIEERDRLRKRQGENPTEDNRKAWNLACQETEEAINGCKQERWSEARALLDPRKGSHVSRILKAIDNKRGGATQTQAKTNIIQGTTGQGGNQEIADTLANHYAEVSTRKFTAEGEAIS